MKTYGNLDLRNCCCMDLMKEYPDNYFDLAIVDPPYGIGDKLVKGGGGGGWKNMVNSGANKWDIAPPQEYFIELFRVSQNQIIWGGNYFNLPICRQPIAWDKVRPNQKNVSEWEYAWSSFNGRARLFAFCNNGGFLLESPRIHPTQKPKELYRWLLSNWAKEGDKILDTHLGSGSIAIACYYMGFNLTGSELDPDYYKAMMERIDKETRQQELF